MLLLSQDLPRFVSWKRPWAMPCWWVLEVVAARVWQLWLPLWRSTTTSALKSPKTTKSPTGMMMLPPQENQENVQWPPAITWCLMPNIMKRHSWLSWQETAESPEIKRLLMSVGGGSQEAPVQAWSVWGNSHTSPRLCQKWDRSCGDRCLKPVLNDNEKLRNTQWDS